MNFKNKHLTALTLNFIGESEYLIICSKSFLDCLQIYLYEIFIQAKYKKLSENS